MNKRNRGKHKKNKNTKLFKTTWITMIILISILLTQYLVFGINDVLAVGRSESIVSIEIPNNSGINEIADILCEKGVIKNTNFFKMYSVLTQTSKNFISGNFELKTNMDYKAIINHIQDADNIKDKVTVTLSEGLNIMECANILEQNQVCEAKDFMELCKSNFFDNDYSFLSSIPNSEERYYKLEGYLYPDTYKFYKNKDPKDSIKIILDNYKLKSNQKNEVSGFDSKVNLEDRAKASGMNLDKLMILASIIQFEATDENDMANVSSVFHNRLNTIPNAGISPYGDYGMGLLGSCATVWYPYKTKEQVPFNILDKFKSTYDTYVIQGLPPGPICNPGIQAIEAALNPNSTKYYFFCHDKNDNPYYAETLKQHNENIQKAGII